MPPSHPTGRDVIAADLCVIGAGMGGLQVAVAAAAAGKRVVVIEKQKIGGNDIAYGSLPSKALAAAAKRAFALRNANAFGIAPVHPSIDQSAIRDHVFSVVQSASEGHTAERYTALGIRIIKAAARFTDKKTLQAGDFDIKARRFVIATGSTPEIPNLPGLETVAFFTNETIFDHAQRIDRLLVIGGGAVALELAQSKLRLGSAVTVLSPGPALPDNDREQATIILRALRNEGMTIFENATVENLAASPMGIRAVINADGEGGIEEASHLLIASGRVPNLSELNLDAAHVKTNESGIIVNSALRTSNPRVYAIGDVTGTSQGTAAHHHAAVVAQRLLLGLKSTVSAPLIPRVTFTEPQLAWVGLSEEDAQRRGSFRVLRWPYSESEKAIADRRTDGHVKVLVDAKGTLLGAGVAGAGACEQIQIWALALANKLPLSAMITYVPPYPAIAGIHRQAALRSFTAGRSPLKRGFLSRWFG